MTTVIEVVNYKFSIIISRDFRCGEEGECCNSVTSLFKTFCKCTDDNKVVDSGIGIFIINHTCFDKDIIR